MVRDPEDGSGNFLHSKEVVTQGEPLVMIAYYIQVLPLIRDLQGTHPRVTKPWYMNNSGSGGKFAHILAHLQELQERGPPRGYFPKPTKSILVMAPQNVSWAEEFFRGMGITVVTGNIYLGGFIGESKE